MKEAITALAGKILTGIAKDICYEKLREALQPIYDEIDVIGKAMQLLMDQWRELAVAIALLKACLEACK